ncbi:lysophospholipid acyltransferase family protein [Aquabacterium sp. J223]|uniref:lysophospholipid acyltransferase family protein n=1 Tax=Aquabacterium sp. J223 TaxID=2898431 RepID=UPI0021ADB9E0|nr:lysophospholipid acyltransferase family protein [Aquabacterium sp. J223]UUX97949.1 1-acyl-sn-glycerol-3-phosphate acyltransferase [Aquabacterium sp. J223]
MRPLRAIARLMVTTGHVLRGLAIVALRFPRLDAAGRQREIRQWARAVLAGLGVALDVQGTPHAGPVLLVANHVSWLDILAVHASCPQARFVSKADVRHWPLVGRLVVAAGTLFIEREKRRDALRVVHQMAQALQAGDTVAVFPEGTTGEGRGLLPFHANLLQAALSAQAPVQPLVLRFADASASPSPAAAYVGDTSLVQSLWWIANARGLVVRVRWLPVQAPGAGDRRALAEGLRDTMGRALAALDPV